MKIFVVSLVLVASVIIADGQSVRLSGTIFDYNGAVVVAGTVKATPGKSDRPVTATSNENGDFTLELKPGVYSLEVSGNGLLTVRLPEYLVVNSSSGMKMDFVMFGAKYQEPCGYSGVDCLPARMLIKEFTIKYSPSLKQITEDFSDLNKKKNNK